MFAPATAPCPGFPALAGEWLRRPVWYSGYISRTAVTRKSATARYIDPGVLSARPRDTWYFTVSLCQHYNCTTVAWTRMAHFLSKLRHISLCLFVVYSPRDVTTGAPHTSHVHCAAFCEVLMQSCTGCCTAGTYRELGPGGRRTIITDVWLVLQFVRSFITGAPHKLSCSHNTQHIAIKLCMALDHTKYLHPTHPGYG